MDGMFARMDAQRGVWKAPAGEELRGVSGLTVALGEFERGDLNTRGINLIVALANRGVCVWGARTADLGSEYRYVNVRRLLIYLKESISRSLQWAVFEPNNEALWAEVRQVITNFMTSLWREGALMGQAVEDAYFVQCDRNTMTQADSGRPTCLGRRYRSRSGSS